jgi:hypothetical protein
LSEQDVSRIHELWVEMTGKPGWEHLHHKDVVSIALACLQHDLTNADRNDALEQLRSELPKANLSESAVQEKRKA